MIDVNDAIVARWEQLAEVYVEELQVPVNEHSFRVEILQRQASRVEGEYEQFDHIAGATADTVWAALRDCATQLERAATRTQT